jgi:Ser/Thr protein kinase RdoA (MazF antagonist)
MEPNLKQEFIRKIKFTTKLNTEKKDFVIDNLNNLPDSNSICHCDFHPDNIILSSRGPVVIDWVNSLIGNPLADVARTSLMLRSFVLPPEPTPYWIKNRTSRLKFHSIYLEEYLKLCVLDVKEFEIWELPVATVRLGENIVEEEQQLLFSIDNRIYKNINDIPNSVQ